MTDKIDSTGIPVERITGTKSPRTSLDARIVLENGEVFESDVIRIQSFSGQESISNLFEFKLDLRANDYTFYDSSPEWLDIDPSDPEGRLLVIDQLLGASITVMIGMPESDVSSESHSKTYFNGMIQSVSLLDRGVWNITMVPRLSLLKLQSSYRIFNDMTILEVISALFNENQIVHTAYRLLDDGEPDENYATPVVTGLAVYRKQDWLQAGETDFDFFTRLLTKAGLLYYFVHSSDRHILVLTDTNYYQSLWHYKDHTRIPDGQLARQLRKTTTGAPARRLSKQSSLARSLMSRSSLSAQLKPEKTLKRLYLTSAILGQDLDDSISQFNFQRSLAVKGVTTVLAHKEASWETQNPAVTSPVFKDDRLATPYNGYSGLQSLGQSPGARQLNMEKLLVVSFGASEYELNIRNQLIEQKLQSSRTSLSGTSSYAGLQSGYIFQLEDSRSSSMNRESTRRKIPDEAFRPEVANKNSMGGVDNSVQPESRKMVAVSVSHNANVDGKYSNQFTALDASGFGVPYEANGDTEGTVIAQVCSKDGDTSSTTASFYPGVSTTTSSGGNGSFYLPKESFSNRFQKTFIASSTIDSTYKAQGLYVKFVTQDHSAAPLWVRLSDSMSTVPEIGAFVLIGRARDETELPEIQQVLDANGTRNVMPAEYTKSTSWGDSYSMSYGDSHRISLPMLANTSFQASTNIVNYQTQLGEYSDVSFSESSGFSYSVSRKSQSISVNGNADLVDMQGIEPQHGGRSDYVQMSKSITNGDTYSDTTLNGKAYNYSISNGYQYSVSTTRGGSYSQTTQWENQVSVTTINGDSNSTTTQTGNSITNTTQIGDSTTISTIEGVSNSTTTQTGSAYTNTSNTRTENVSSVDTSISTSTTGASKATTTTGTSNNINITGASANTSVTGASINTNVTGASGSVDVTGVSTSVKLTGVSFDLGFSNLRATINAPGYAWQSKPEPEVATSSVKINFFGLKIEF